ncbi:MAG: hypothetical protein ACK5MJ_06660 [Alphaproteobacteria bacterium]
MLFAGQYETKLERRGRVQLPKTFIHSLAKQHFKGVYVFPSLNGNYLEGCGDAWLAYWSRKMDDKGSLLGKGEVLTSNVMDMMAALEVDKSARITLPTELISYVYLNTPLMIVGRGFRFQIWNKEKFLEHRAAMRTEFHLVQNSKEALELMPQQNEELASTTKKPTKVKVETPKSTTKPEATKLTVEKKPLAPKKTPVKSVSKKEN